MKFNRLIALVSFLIYWGPSDELGYVWAFLLVFIALLFGHKNLRFSPIIFKNFLLPLILIGFVSIGSFIINYFLLETAWQNLFWSIYTYGSAYGFVFILFLFNYDMDDLKWLFKVSIVISCFEPAIMYSQILISTKFVTPFPWLIPFGGDKAFGTLAFNSQLSAIKMGMIFLLYFPLWLKHKTLLNTVILGWFLFGYFIPFSVATFLGGMVAIFLCYIVKDLIKILIRSRIKKYLISSFVVMIFSLPLVYAFLNSKNNNVLANFIIIYNSLVDGELATTLKNSKVQMYQHSLGDLQDDYPQAKFIGVGPGNYSSRSSWIVSGYYLPYQPSFIPATPSEIMTNDLSRLWNREMIWGDKGEGSRGSLAFTPFSSWVSVFAEIGLLGFILMIVFWRNLFRFFRKGLYLRGSPELLYTFGYGMILNTVFLSIIFLYENMMEYPAVMGQFFLYAVVYIKALEGEMNKERTTIEISE